jgi:mono/diheme cytochrome c family protein
MRTTGAEAPGAIARTAGAALAFFALAAGSAAAQEPAQGEAIYAQNCAICHGANGEGTNVFPSLADNQNLEDTAFLVSVLHQGIVNMPPVPWLSDEETAVLANYLRTSFGNSYGAISPEEVAAARADLEPPGEIRTIWDGVFTEDQADRGEQLASGNCGMCHGSRFNGVPDDNDMQSAPPLARHKFLATWNGRPLGAVFAYSQLTMPLSNPGYLPAEDYAALVAYMLAASGASPGDVPLSADAVELGYIRIEPRQ